MPHERGQTVEVWGTGTATREIPLCRDAAEGLSSRHGTLQLSEPSTMSRVLKSHPGPVSLIVEMTGSKGRLSGMKQNRDDNRERCSTPPGLKILWFLMATTLIRGRTQKRRSRGISSVTRSRLRLFFSGVKKGELSDVLWIRRH